MLIRMAGQFLKVFVIVNYNNLFYGPDYSVTRAELGKECYLLRKEDK